ncbi:methyltransferase domain-containing protein [Bosea sp. BIWAKO-01]|uniref:methyltransferase domain-containing protein n=1 Tax=Bosea sp. BIWAKO-01 TaxID=506668 RepID=UPI00085304E2|nr:methyltransferase domain-containing protein [Bosea sp. BIWAKO-01]GAU85530.1 N-methyltransferase homolog [Bosea sp. BIWAKO-01]
MIIDLFGATGATRASFASELCKRLRESGQTAEIIQGDWPATGDPARDPPGKTTGHVFRGIGQWAAAAVLPLSRRLGFWPGFDILAMLPPANAAWFGVLRQYNASLSHAWSEAARSDQIVIFEQGFVQTVCLLATHSWALSEATLEAALEQVPKADLVICIDAQSETPETDFGMSHAAAPVIARADGLLHEHGTPVISLAFQDEATLGSALDVAVEEVLARRPVRAPIGTSAARAAAGLTTGRSGLAHPTVPAPAATAAAGSVASAAWAPQQAIPLPGMHALLPYLIGALLAFLVEFLAARVIGAHSYGIYAFAFACASVVAYSSTLGFNISLVRLLPAYLARQESSLARGVIQYAVRRTLATAMAIAVVGATFVTMYPGFLRPEVIATCLMALAAAPLLTLLLISGSVTRSFGGALSVLAIERVVLNGLVLGVIFLTAWYHLWPRDATLVMGSTLVGSAMAAMVLVPALRGGRPRAVRVAVANYAAAEWRSSIAPLTMIVAAEIVLNRAGVIVLGLEGRITKVGIFGIALSMATLATRPLVAFGRSILPLASRLDGGDDRPQLQALLSHSARLSLMAAVLISVPLLLLTDPLLNWLGPDFERAGPVLRILLVGQVVAAAFGSQQALMTMAGQERAAATMLIAGAAVNIVATIVANRFWGLTGAAVATVVTVIALNLALAIFLRLRLQIRPGLASAAPPVPMHWSRSQLANGRSDASTVGATWEREPRGGARGGGGLGQPYVPQCESYRVRSTGAGYGQRYVRIFSEGYYAINWREVEAPLLREIFAGLASRGASRSLDFACGTGRILELHEEAFDDIVGVDISPEMLAHARARYPEIRFVEADLTRTGAIEAVSDRQVCTAFRFFLNAEPSLRAEVLDVLRNCLVKDGVLVANFHGNPASLVGLVYPLRNRIAGREIYKLMREDEAVALLEAHGFAVEEVHWYGLWPPVFRKFDWLNTLCMAPVEALGRRFPALMRRCQTFVVVARRR